MLETFRQAFRSIFANKLRSSLTILGIIVGIFSIILVSTVISMLQKSIEEGVSALNKNTFQIQRFPAFRTGGVTEWAKFRNRKIITLDNFYDFKEKMTEAESVGGEVWRFGRTVKFENKKTNPNVMFCGATPEAFPNNKWLAQDGRLFNQDEVFRGQKIIVLGSDIAKTLFDYRDPLGEEIKVDGANYRVVGVLESQGASFGNNRDNFVVVPISAFQSKYGKKGSLNITVKVWDDGNYQDIIEKSEGYMRTIRKVAPGEDNDFDIFSNESIMGRINEMTASVKVGSLVIAGIALLAAGIGIMNIMLVSVTERTREIGVRKAVGAKKRTVLFQFLSEAVALCITGGIMGIILGVALGNFVGSMMDATAAIPYTWIGIGIVICVFIGVLFGTYPAYKAANLDPIESLRYE